MEPGIMPSAPIRTGRTSTTRRPNGRRAITMLPTSFRHMRFMICRKDVGSIVIARRPFGLLVVDVLPVRIGADGIIPGSIVTGVVGHAFGVGVGDLIL